MEENGNIFPYVWNFPACFLPKTGRLMDTSKKYRKLVFSRTSDGNCNPKRGRFRRFYTSFIREKRIAIVKRQMLVEGT
jgi:hypothetical protein